MFGIGVFKEPLGVSHVLPRISDWRVADLFDLGECEPIARGFEEFGEGWVFLFPTADGGGADLAKSSGPGIADPAAENDFVHGVGDLLGEKGGTADLAGVALPAAALRGELRVER